MAVSWGRKNISDFEMVIPLRNESPSVLGTAHVEQQSNLFGFLNAVLGVGPVWLVLKVNQMKSLVLFCGFPQQRQTHVSNFDFLNRHMGFHAVFLYMLRPMPLEWVAPLVFDRTEFGLGLGSGLGIQLSQGCKLGTFWDDQLSDEFGRPFGVLS